MHVMWSCQCSNVYAYVTMYKMQHVFRFFLSLSCSPSLKTYVVTEILHRRNEIGRSIVNWKFKIIKSSATADKKTCSVHQCALFWRYGAHWTTQWPLILHQIFVWQKLRETKFMFGLLSYFSWSSWWTVSAIVLHIKFSTNPPCWVRLTRKLDSVCTLKISR